jgi:hypothetical protein
VKSSPRAREESVNSLALEDGLESHTAHRWQQSEQNSRVLYRRVPGAAALFTTAALRSQGTHPFRCAHTMFDLIYVLGTIAFFALMLAYVRACARLGQSASADQRADIP